MVMQSHAMPMRVTIILWASFLALALAAGVHSLELKRGSPFSPQMTPYHFNEIPRLKEGDELYVRGVNSSHKDIILIVRIDDYQSSSYHNRLNYEQVVPPGEFTLRLALSGMQTPNGRHLDRHNIQKIMIFVKSIWTAR